MKGIDIMLDWLRKCPVCSSKSTKGKITAWADATSTRPTYTNMTSVERSKLIFQLDFLHNNPDRTILLGRYMMPPIQAKILRDSLSERIETHEKEYGAIQETKCY